MNGSNIGLGALYGAIGAAAGYGLGQLGLFAGNPALEFVVQAAGGGLIGGGMAELAGGHFREGFFGGLISAAMGFMVGKLVNVADTPQEDKVIHDLMPGVVYATGVDLWGELKNPLYCQDVATYTRGVEKGVGFGFGKDSVEPLVGCEYRLVGTFRKCYYPDSNWVSSERIFVIRPPAARFTLIRPNLDAGNLCPKYINEPIGVPYVPKRYSY